jgi:hypothetical protein
MMGSIGVPGRLKAQVGPIGLQREFTNLGMAVAAGEILHLALPPIAFCMSGKGQSGLQKACADSSRSSPHLIYIAPQVAAGGAFVEL